VVFTIMEAPERGWTSQSTIGGFAVAAAAAAVFVAWERRRPHPMLDVSLFRNLRFSAASGSIMVIFFALAGFVFLITQYFQFLKGYAPLSTGARILPVAICIAVGSLVGVRLAVGIGTKAVVAPGLLLVGVSFGWVSTASTATPYGEIVGQMILAGLGMGLTTAPATAAIMGVAEGEGRHRLRRQRRHPRARRHPRRRHHRQRLRVPLRVAHAGRGRIGARTCARRRQRLHRCRARSVHPAGTLIGQILRAARSEGFEWGRHFGSNAGSNGPGLTDQTVNDAGLKPQLEATIPDGGEPSGTCGRREWDSNPRWAGPTHAFQACRFGRSRIPPRVAPGQHTLSCAASVTAGGGRVLCNRSP
jgi:hypothetical protein